MGYRARIVAAALCACVVGFSQNVVQGAQRAVTPAARALPAVTAPPLPFSVAPPQLHARGALDGKRLTRTTVAKRPRAVTLRQALAHTNGRRRIRSATGATVTLLGDHNAYASGAPQIADYTLSWGEQVGFDCSNLTASESNLSWILFPPDGSALVSPATVSTDSSGNCTSSLKDVTLSTPYGSGTDTPYSGVWTVALRRSNGDYEAVTYFVVTGEPSLSTYSDGALNVSTRDFTAGQTVYVVANGLNPSDNYAIGFVQTSAAPMKCVAAVPATFLALPNCFAQSVANAGVQATSGTFEASWSTGSASAGQYTVQLYDVTQHHLLATQQIALQSSSVTWTFTPYQGSTSGTTGLTDNVYAFDGFLDQSVTGLTYAVAGLGSSGTFRLTVTDPHGAVLTSGLAADGSHLAAPATISVAGGSGTSAKIPFALNSTKNTVVGPTATFNAANTFLAQVYDPTSRTVLAAKSFTLLAYSASFAWQGASSVNAAPGNSCGITAQHALTVTNTAGTVYGTSNGDGIVGLKIAPDATNTETVCGGDATATDSAGNLWNVTYSGGTATATIASAKPSALPVGGTLSFNVILAGPSSACGGPTCSLQTQILPLHGLSYSTYNTASNGLIVGGKNNSSVPSDYAWAVTSPSPGNGITAPPPFTQMMYVSGTDAATSAGNYYTVTATLQNNNGSGTSNDINDVLFTFPSSFDFTTAPYTPSLLSLKTQSGTTVSGWNVYVKSGSNNVPNAYSFAIANGTSNSTSPTNGLQPGTTYVATFKFPMPSSSMALQQIAASGNFDGGCIQNTATHCTYATTAFGSASTQNSVAGPLNVDSTELGFYSLDVAKMSGVFAPQTIGAGVATSSTWTFTNTPTSADPNPDYVDAITLTFPTGAIPTSITAPTGWTVTGSGATWTVSTTCTPSPCQETSAVAPGGTLALTVSFPSTTTTGTYDGVGTDPAPIFWYVRGANGGTTTPSTTTKEGTSKLVVSPVSASVKFAAVGGYPTATTVASGNEPYVGSDADVTYGNAYDYRITNNGSATITNATIAIPVNNRAGAVGTDTSGQNWQITSTPSAGSCTVTVTQVQTSPSPANGSIALSGCSLAPGASLDVTFDAKAPYDIGSEFDWPATVCSGSGCSSPVNASPAWTTAEYVKIVVDARLSIIYYSGSSPVVGAAPSLPNPGPGGSGPGGSTPTTSCPFCTIVATGSAPQISLGSFTGTATFADLVDAAVISDAVGPDSWSLYVSVDANPLNGASVKEVSMKIDTAVMNALTGLTIPSGVTSFFQPPATGSGVYPTAASGTLIGTYNGNAHRTAIDSIHTFQINDTGATGSQSVTIMWTVIPN